MRGSWIARPGELVVVGSFGDVEPHHHPAVQVAVGLGGVLDITDGDGVRHRGAVAVIGSGHRHALRSAGADAALSVYHSPETPVAMALNASVDAAGIRIPANAATVAARIEAAVRDDDLAGAADLLGELTDPVRAVDAPAHAHLRKAIAAVAAAVPERAALRDVADRVALSPDYLGRLFRAQTGSSYSATVRWVRLLAALAYARDGATLTDAAHMAGFADGAHATRTCRELTGAAPSAILRALA